MKVLVDTSVWSLAFRHKQLQAPEKQIVERLKTLILDGNAYMIGLIRQELLSGIKHAVQYARLREKLKAFDDLLVLQEDHERAAEMFNTCRAQGVQGSHIDFLICAIAQRYKLPIFAVDGDFEHYKTHLPIKLYIEVPTNRLHELSAKYQKK